MASTDSSASSIRSVVTSTGAPSKYPSQLLLAPAFLTCAGAILFRGISDYPHPSSSSSSWTPPSPPSLQSSSPESSPASFRPLNLAPDADALSYADADPRRRVSESSSSPPLEVCIIYHQRKNEYILSKGRKDQFEAGLLDTAMRETHEETGFPCRPYPVAQLTRAPLPGADIKDTKDGVPVLNCVEPFALTIRNISPDNVKLIYWFIAEATASVADEGTRMPSESAFTSCWFTPEDAIERLTHEHDRDVVRKAVALVRAEAARKTLDDDIKK